jgi:hypothetical protein
MVVSIVTSVTHVVFVANVTITVQKNKGKSGKVEEMRFSTTNCVSLQLQSEVGKTNGRFSELVGVHVYVLEQALHVRFGRYF